MDNPIYKHQYTQLTFPSSTRVVQNICKKLLFLTPRQKINKFNLILRRHLAGVCVPNAGRIHTRYIHNAIANSNVLVFRSSQVLFSSIER